MIHPITWDDGKIKNLGDGFVYENNNWVKVKNITLIEHEYEGSGGLKNYLAAGEYINDGHYTRRNPHVQIESASSRKELVRKLNYSRGKEWKLEDDDSSGSVHRGGRRKHSRSRSTKRSRKTRCSRTVVTKR